MLEAIPLRGAKLGSWNFVGSGLSQTYVNDGENGSTIFKQVEITSDLSVTAFFENWTSSFEKEVRFARGPWVRVLATTNEVRSLAFKPDPLWPNRFVAVGGNGAAWWSDDGINWAPGNTPTTNRLNAVVRGNGAGDDYPFGAFFAGGRGGSFLYSMDGVTWSNVAPEFSFAEPGDWSVARLYDPTGNGAPLLGVLEDSNVISTGRRSGQDGRKWYVSWPTYTEPYATHGDVVSLVPTLGNGRHALVGKKVWIQRSTGEWGDFVEQQPIGNSFSVNDVASVTTFNPATKVAVGNSGFIWLNKGEWWSLGNWQRVPSPTTEDLTSISAREDVFLAGGRHGITLASLNGSNWVSGRIGSSAVWQTIHVGDRTYAATGDGIYVSGRSINFRGGGAEVSMNEDSELTVPIQVNGPLQFLNKALTGLNWSCESDNYDLLPPHRVTIAANPVLGRMEVIVRPVSDRHGEVTLRLFSDGIVMGDAIRVTVTPVVDALRIQTANSLATQRELPCSLAAVRFVDVEESNPLVRLTLSNTVGRLVFHPRVRASLTETNIVAESDRHLEILAPLSSVNGALGLPGSVQYWPEPGFIGQAELTLSAQVVNPVDGPSSRGTSQSIQVQVLGSEFDAWIAGRLAAAEESVRTNVVAQDLTEKGDADDDGQDNSLELAFGTDPFSARSRGELTHGLILSNGLYYFQLSFPRAVPAGQFVAGPMVSTNLKNWSQPWQNLTIISNRAESATVERVWVRETVGSANPERYGRVESRRNANLAISTLVPDQQVAWTGPDTVIPVGVQLDTAGSPIRLLRLREGTNVVATVAPPDLTLAFRPPTPGIYLLTAEAELQSGEAFVSQTVAITVTPAFQLEWLTRLDAIGIELGKTLAEVRPEAMAVDAAGNTVVAARVTGRKVRLNDLEFSVPPVADADRTLLAKFNPVGLPLWTTWVVAGGTPTGLGAFADGSFVLLGQFSDFSVLGGLSSGERAQNYAFGAALGSTSGRSYLATFSPEGKPRTLRYLPEATANMATTEAGRIVVASQFSHGPTSNPVPPVRITEFDAQLALRWQTAIPHGRGANATFWQNWTDALRIAADGRVWWGGHFSGTIEVGPRFQAAQDRPDSVIVRLDTDGSIDQGNRALSGTNRWERAGGLHGLTAAQGGAIYSLASAGTGDFSGDLAVSRFNPAGDRQWEFTLPKQVRERELFRGIEAPDGGLLMVHGEPEVNFRNENLNANRYLSAFDTNGVARFRNVLVTPKATAADAVAQGGVVFLTGRVPKTVTWGKRTYTNQQAEDWQVDGYVGAIHLAEGTKPLIPFIGTLGAIRSAEADEEYVSDELVTTNLLGPRELRLTHTFPPGAVGLRINGNDLVGDRLDVTNGMTVQVVGTSGTAEGDSRHAYLSLAGFQTRWSVHRPPAPDRLPAPFVFATVREVVTNSWHTSTNVLISDLDVPVQATNTAGILIVNGVEVGLGPVTVTNGTTLAVRLQAPGRYVPSVSTRVTVGEYSTDFVLELKAPVIEVPTRSVEVPESLSTLEGALQLSQPIVFSGTNGTRLNATNGVTVLLNGSVVPNVVQLTKGDIIRFRANAPTLNGLVQFPYTIGELSAIWRLRTVAPLAARPAPAGEVSGFIDGTPSVTPGGAALYSIPIFAPPGTAGLDPELTLAYSSQGSFGAVGLGWSLQGISVITRVAQTVAQDGHRGGINLDANDRFALNGERLMLARGTEGLDGADYRTEKDSFQRVQVVGRHGNGPRSFQVKTKSGLTLDFGTTADSQLLANRNGSVSPTNAILSWALSRITDTAGNYLTFTYLNDALNGEVNLSRIDYTGNPNAGLLPYASVRCEYEANTISALTQNGRIVVLNPDVRYVAGSRMQGTRRLKRIAAYVGEQLVRRYDLSYEFRGLLGRPHLTSVTETGRDGASHPPTTFAYEGQDAQEGPASGEAYEHPLLSFAERQRLFFNQGISQAKYWFVDPNLSSLNMGRIRMGDFNGDGRSDLYFLDGINECGGDQGKKDPVFFSQDFADPTRVYPGVREVLDADRFGISSIICGTSFGAIDLARYQVGDFNGDGRADIYRSVRSIPAGTNRGGTHLNIIPNLSTPKIHAWQPGAGVQAYIGDDEEALADLSRFRFMDFDGDGRTDIYRFVSRDGLTADRLHLARGATDGTPLSWATYKAVRHRIPTGSAADGQAYSDQVMLSTARFHFGDFNGDGKTDILRIEGRGTSRADVVLYLFPGNLPEPDGDLAFVELPDRFAGLYNLRVRQDFNKALIDLSRVKPGDFNGDGLTDLYIVHEPGPGVQMDAILFSKGDGTFYKTNGLQTAISDATDDRTKVDLARIKMTDFNGDGKTDVFRMRGNNSGGSESTKDVIHVSNGDGTFQGPYKCLNYSISSNDTDALSDVSRVQFADINGDGRADVLAMRDEDGDSFSVNLRLQQVAHPELLTTVTTGHGGITRFAYKPLSALVDTNSPPTRPYPYVPFRAGLYVVTEMQQSNGLTPESGEPTVNTSQFAYFGGVLDVSGRGFLGFEEVRQRDLARGSESVTRYVVNDGIKAGMPLSTELFVTNRAVSPAKRQLVSWTQFTPASKKTIGNAWLTYQEFQTATDYDFDTGAALKTTKTFLYYNNETDTRHGNLTSTSQIVSRGDATGADEFRETSEHRYADNETLWFLGRLERSTVTKRAFLPDGRRLETTRVSAFRYDSVTGFRTEETIEPDRDELYWRKTYQFNRFGGITNSSQTAGLVNTGLPRELFTYYESTGRFITNTVNARGHTEGATFDAGLGVKLTQTGPNGLTTRREYDGFGRAIAEHRADGTTSRSYYRRVLAGNGPASAVYFVESHPDGAGIQRTYFDLLGREVRRESEGFDGRWIVTDSVYNARGQKIRESRPYFLGDAPQWTQFNFDDAGRLTSMLEPGNRLHRTEYSLANGLPKVTSVNPLGQHNSRVTDVRGQLIQSIDNLGQSVFYAYDAYGNLLRTQHGTTNLVVTELEYDVRGRKVAMRDPSLGHLAYRYNGFGELIWQRDNTGYVTEMEYDTLGRMISRGDPDGEFRWIFDTADFGKGLIARVEGPGGYLEQHYYDALARPCAVVKHLPEGSGQMPVLTLGTSYDPFSRPDVILYPSGFTLRHLYNEFGFLSQVRSPSQGDHRYWAAIKYNAQGQILKEELGNALVRHQAYDPDTQFLTNILTTLAVESSRRVQELSYAWNDVGNLLQRGDPLAASEVFAYDGLNRLTSATVASTTVSLTFDELGNIKSKSDVGTYAYDRARPMAVAAITGGPRPNEYSYDNNGNRVASRNEIVRYNHRAQPLELTSLRNGSVSTFRYDPAGDRYAQTTTRTNGETRTRLYLGGLYELEAIFGDNPVIKETHYVRAGGQLVALHHRTNGESGTNQCVLTDHLGSIERLTDDWGQVAEYYNYDAWGRRRDHASWQPVAGLAGLSTPRGFTGHEHLDEFELVHMNARLYDPVTGRFCSADSMVQGAGTADGLNPYTYGLNRPLSGVDPDGHFFFVPVVISLVKAAVIAGAKAAVLSVATQTLVGIGTGKSFGEALVGGLKSSGKAAAVGAIGGAFGELANITTSYAEGDTFAIWGRKMLTKMALSSVSEASKAAVNGDDLGRAAIMGAPKASAYFLMRYSYQTFEHEKVIIHHTGGPSSSRNVSHNGIGGAKGMIESANGGTVLENPTQGKVNDGLQAFWQWNAKWTGNVENDSLARSYNSSLKEVAAEQGADLHLVGHSQGTLTMINASLQKSWDPTIVASVKLEGSPASLGYAMKAFGSGVSYKMNPNDLIQVLTPRQGFNGWLNGLQGVLSGTGLSSHNAYSHVPDNR